MELNSTKNPDRLASLHSTGLIGTRSEPEIDRLTRLVTKVLDVPVALVSLVDHDHQFFKSCVGLPEPWATERRTPLSHSFCQHVVDRQSVLSISDARTDPLVQSNLAVRDLGVVAYLGFPLTRSDGQTIGALCAIDGKPRHWTDADRDLMSELAGTVIAAIEARQAQRALLVGEQAIREAQIESRLQRRLDFILDVMPQLAWTATPEGNVAYYNQRWFDYTGMTFEQTKDWGWQPVLHPDDLQPCLDLWQTAIEAGAPYQGEFRFKRGSDSRYRWHLNRALPRRDDTGKIVEWIGTSTDIDDHKLAELKLIEARSTLESRVELRTAELQDQKRFVEAVLTNVSDGVIACDANGTITYLNPAIQRMFDLNELPDNRSLEWVMQNLPLYEPNGDRPTAWSDRPLGKALKGESVVGVEYLIRPPGKSPRNLVIGARPMTDSDGKIIGAVATWHDTTTFVEHEKQLVLAKEAAEVHRKGLERFQFLVDGAKDYAIYMLNESGTVETWNTGASRLKGYDPKEIIGQNFECFYPAEDIASGKPAHNLAVARMVGKLEEDSWRVRKDGSRFWANVVIEAMHDAAGNAIGFSKITRDLTERRDAEQIMANMNHALRAQAAQLEQATLAAEMANHAKSSFLANMSHEIRTPIAAILGYTDLLLDPKRGRSDRFNDLQAVRRNGKHLLELISDVLDLSKIEAGRTEIEKIETNLARLAAEVISMTRPKAVEKALDLKLEFLTPVPQKIITDPLRLRQVLVNLIGNAIKFTAQGQIVVAIRCDSHSDRDTEVSFEVRDSGVGMAQEQLQRLFKPFVQADASTTRKFGGTGLGLTISRQLAHLLGGEISVQSEAGRGSTFTLTMNVGPTEACKFVSGLNEATTAPAPTTSVPELKVNLNGARVLLAEDGIDNREILTAYLNYAGARVDTAENGRDAVTRAFAASASADPYAIVIMDMQMPVLDGYAATSELRIRQYSGPIIALTANAMCDDRRKCLSAGCDFYLSKPVDQREFLETVARYAGQSRAVMAATDVSTPVPPAEQIELQNVETPTIRSSFANDPLLAAVIQKFIGRLPQLTDELASLLNDGLTDDLRRAAHKLRGAGGSYGLPQLSSAAGVLEDGLKNNASIEVAARDVQELTKILRSVEGYDAAREKLKAI